MFKLTALAVVLILYIIPLNIPLYHVAELTAVGVFNNNEVISYASSVFYVLYAAIIFIAIYYAIKILILENTGADIDKEARIKAILLKHEQGQKRINLITISIILLLILVHILLLILDIKLIVMAVLCIIFIFR